MVRRLELKPEEMRDLMLAVLERGKRVRLGVTGPSMAPTIYSGDAIELSPMPRGLAIGEIALFQTAKGNFYVHRLIRIERSGGNKHYIFKGDGLTLADSPVPAEKILGRVTGVWRKSSPHSFRLPLVLPGCTRLISAFHRLRPWVMMLQRKLIGYIA